MHRKKGKGLNLTLETLDGILCHNGELHDRILKPEKGKTFVDFDRECLQTAEIPDNDIRPSTLEGCVVRLSDTIGYIGRDIEDAIELKLINRDDIPVQCKEILGSTNGTIVYNLVNDLIINSLNKEFVGFSRDVSSALQALKEFNYKHIYLNPKIKKGFLQIERCYWVLFETFLVHLDKDISSSVIFRDFIESMESFYIDQNTPAEVVRDFIAGMTDNYFLTQARQLGCDIPIPWINND